MEFLTILGQDVELTIKPVAKQKSGQQGRMSVTVKAARQIVLQVEGDEKYNKWSRSIAKKLQQDIIPLLHNDKDFDPIERLLEVMR